MEVMYNLSGLDVHGVAVWTFSWHRPGAALESLPGLIHRMHQAFPDTVRVRVDMELIPEQEKAA